MSMQMIKLQWEAKSILPVEEVGFSGVYAFGLKHKPVMYEGKERTHSIYYIGKTRRDIAGRWGEHVKDWLGNSEYWTPKSVDDFLKDPVAVINNGNGYRQNCGKHWERLFHDTFFCYARFDTQDDDLLRCVEYTLQENVKRFIKGSASFRSSF